ncbi:MAG: GNAT family N-acetyltransferase [Pseudonocardia sp.]
MYVRPWARGYGLGARLVDAAVDVARELGFHGFRLATDPATTGRALQLYRAAGFTDIAPCGDIGPAGLATLGMRLTTAARPATPPGGAGWARGDPLRRRPRPAGPASVTRDVRVCVLGDSFVAGVGDPEHRGWVGRVAAAGPQPVTVYNLGVRRDTSADVLARWRAECVPRLPAGVDGRLVVAFGVNDTAAEGGSLRVRPATSAANLAALVDAAPWPVLAIGPPPVAEPAQNARITAVDGLYAEVCAARGIPYVPVAGALLVDPCWMAEVARGDGAHPGAPGYARLAEAVLPAWWAWLDG